MSNITNLPFGAIIGSLLFAILPVFSQAQNDYVAVVSAERTNKRTASATFDDAARFPGCETVNGNDYEKMQCADAKLSQFIEDNLEYPIHAKGPQFKPRTVRVEFVVEPDGKMHSLKLVHPDKDEYDRNALAVFEKMIKEDVRWIPAMKDGEAVRSTMTTNVYFDLLGRNKAFPSSGLGPDVYELVDEVPAFPSCQIGNRKDREIRDCAIDHMKGFFRKNMNYPDDALLVGLEGEVKVQFIVDKHGVVRPVKLMNDIGLGCGAEAIRLFNLMNEKNIGWVPGVEDGQPVDVVMETTVEFKIKASDKPKAALDLVDAKPIFVSERTGYEEYQDAYLKYPKGEDVNPCQTGTIDVKFKINGAGNVEITKMTDYNGLGKEFKAAATSFLSSTQKEWNSDFPNLDRETEYFLSLPFMPSEGTCPQIPDGYKEAIYSGIDGAAIASDKSKLNDGLKFLDKALRNYPADNKLRYLRGMAYYNAGRKIEACVDLSFVNKQNKDISVPKTCK